MLKELIELSLHTLECYKCERGGLYQGIFSVWLHGQFDKFMVATSSRREGRYPLISSLSPTQGTDTNGSVFAFNFVTKLLVNRMANGMVLDVKCIKQFLHCTKRKN